MKPYRFFGRCALVVMLCAGGGYASGAGVDSRADFINKEFNGQQGGILLAAARDGSAPDNKSGPGYNSALVKAIQENLAKQGYFLGAVDGVFGPETEGAIRAYQKSAGLAVDGKPSTSLSDNLQTGGKVGELLKKLEKAKNRSMDAAKQALLSRPETRNLIEGDFDAGALIKHDWNKCVEKTTPRCLLIEASIAVDEIEKPEMKNWSLGEILAAQAKAGLAEDAMNSARRIHDPQLIMVALRDIAKSQAEAGRHAEAMEAVDIIPDINGQIEAYISITEIMARKGNKQLSYETSEHLLEYLDKAKEPLNKAAIMSRLAVILYNNDEEERSKKYIDDALSIARRINDDHLREKALRHVAAALAESGDPTRALKIIKGAKNGADDVPILMAAATSHALSGRADIALSTADAIEAVRYRSLVLSKIAAYQAGAGMINDSVETLGKALDAAKTIRFPFAKAYAMSRIALSYNDVGISAGDGKDLMAKSLEVADLVSDDRLRAHIIWAIADERKRAESNFYDLAHDKAIAATKDIKSSLSRVWMLCDISEARAEKGDIDGAWDLYDQAKKEAIKIDHPWGRSRALAKVALTLSGLADTTTDRGN